MHQKNLSIHLGPAKVPLEESDPRVAYPEPNFYYVQEDRLAAWCRSQPSGYRPTFSIVMPSHILGAVPEAAMNAAHALAIYAAVCAHLGEPLVFPSDVAAWQNVQAISSARLNAYMEEWVALRDGGGADGEKFNVYDGSAFAWEGTWPKVAAWYELTWRGPEERAEYAEVDTKNDPPPRG